MNKRLIYTTVSFLIALQTFSQMYILNEDFNGAIGTTPPNGWNNILISGSTDDQWHFDNPGNRILNYPVTEPFAIFDADSISADGEAEEVILETPFFDASISNYILLHFVHVFDPGTGGSGTIQAYDGNTWHDILTYSSANSNPSSEILDLSSVSGGITNSSLRFKWSGNGSGYWAIDNIRIYASLPLDGGVVSLDSPNSPVVPGIQNVEITLGNFGYNTLNSAKIDWTANGVAQPAHDWNGAIGFGQTLSNIVIGTYDFQDPVLLKVWQSNPNGQSDLNPYNDTVSKYLVSALCGTYTIGGNNPDFISFSQAADVLNVAGISCPVTFFVRDGIYPEQFEIREIQGVSEVNTITFRSESGDSTLAVIKIIPGALKFESMIYLDGSEHISFQNLGFSTGSSVSYANNAILINHGKNIELTGCYFEVRNQFDFGITIQAGSQEIAINRSRFESISARAGAISIYGDQTREIGIIENNFYGATDWGFATIQIENQSGKINVTGNFLERCYRAIQLVHVDSILIRNNLINDANDGIYVEQFCSEVEISGNRLTNIKSHQNYPEGTYGIFVKSSTATKIFNNFIHTTGNGPVIGIGLENTSSCLVSFNSINITNTDTKGKSKGIFLTGDNAVSANNNIFRVRNTGTPVYIQELSPQLDFDRNDYYSYDRTIGYYNGNRYHDLEAWADSVGMDENSLSVAPFFTSDTDLSINQVLLNNTGIPVPGIANDIDGAFRDPDNPDFGAKEYDPCATDAGVNEIVSPENPLNGGLENVMVLLQNQGTNALTGVKVNWSVNDQIQTVHSWSGDLPGGTNAVITIGAYDFQPGILYSIKAWTSEPDNTTDCDTLNDTIFSPYLAVPLCGIYTIGGTGPDFTTINEAVTLLNLAGITCPVTFLIRDGIYYEQFVIKEIAGASVINTIMFRAESGDSTQAVIKLPPESQKFESMIYLEGSQHIIFRNLGIFTGTGSSYSNNAVFMENTRNIEFEGCYFEVRKDSDLGIGIQEGCQAISIRQNRFESFHPKAIAITAKGAKTRDINILENNIKGATDWGVSTIRIGNDVTMINIAGNQLENCYRAIYLVSSDSALIRGNIIKNANEGIYIDTWCTFIEISGNRLSDLKSHENAPDGTSGITTNNVSQVDVFNNFVHSSGDGPVIGIDLQNTSQGQVSFNSINITNNDVQGKSKGLYLKTCNGLTGRNNIFNIMNSGTPVYISAIPAQIDFDHNDYYSFKQTIGFYNGIVYSDLATWSDSTGMDQHSYSIEPFFTSETDLSINQVLLNNTGSPVAGIAEDIDGVLRNPSQPDIGAKEYNPCANDAGINTIISPESPLIGGTEQIRVILQNQGTGVLSSVKINWSVNDELQSPYAWSGNLPVVANAEVLIGEYDFQTGNSYILKVWTSEPNNGTDCNHENDTVSSRELSGPLCGTYTIGGSNPDFATFAQVAEVLNTSGVTCPVTLLVRDGLYSEKLVIREIPGSSPVNTITFQSENGDSTLAVIRIDPGALNFEPMILLNKSRYIRFQGLGFFTGSASGTSNYALQLEGAKNIEVEGCYMEILNESDYGMVVQGGSQVVHVSNTRFACTDTRNGAINIDGNQTREIDIQGNVITGATAWGNTLIKIGNYSSNITLTGNQIDRSYRAVYVVGADSVLINKNTIRNTNSGIFIDNLCTYVELSANRLINLRSHQNSPEGTSGIQVQNSSEIDIVNNFIQSAGEGPSLGINLQNTTSCRTYYNSVNIINSDAQGKSKGIYIKTADSIKARNNIFNIKISGIPIDIDVNVINLNLDYNNYFHPAGIIGKINGQLYSNLFEWGQTINGDANSKVVNPYFKADTIPLPFQRILNGAGIPLAGILYDIDGKLRYSQAPDMGCMEFFVDYGVLELLNPTLNCFHADVDSVVVYISQFGDVPFNDLKVAYQLNNGPVHVDTIPGPLIEDIIHTFGTTENISAPGEYLFKIWLINTLDDNIINDTLWAIRYSKPPPVVSMDFDNFCTGWEVNFTGEASVDAPYFIDHYEWLFGDGETSDEQNPVHAYTASGTYDVVFRAYSDAGCYSEVISQVFIDPDFQGLGMDYLLVNETCLGDSTGSLELIASGGYPPYTYFVNGVQVNGGSLSRFTSGQYEIKVVDSQNCTLTDSITSVSLVFMNPQITANPLSGYSPLTVEFDFTASGVESWTWYFTESETDTTKTPEYTFYEYGNHEIILEVNSGTPYYCTETVSITVFVDIIITIEINSVFTPNEDGHNDYFEIRSVGLKEMDVNIFNQWGNKMYEIEEVGGKWDGNTKGGAKAPDGTYFYALKATGVDDLVYERQGSVLLLRHGSAAFPNPAVDNVKIKTGEPLDPPVTIKVYSLFGQLAYTTSAGDPENIIVDLSELSSGIYILHATDGTRNCYVRIIKN
jgi:gliding motility-associated-like protein